METRSTYHECVEGLVSDARRIFESEDLISLESMPDFILLDDAKRVMDIMIQFRRQCFRTLSKEEFDEISSIINGALLKIAAALKEKNLESPVARQIIQMFTEDEVNLVLEFEKFNKLDPEITPPDRLADLLVSRTGEIYDLVTEAVRKQYIDFSSLIKTWTTQGKIRAMVSKALQVRYERRFKNIVEAVKRLLDQQPAWLLRLFTDYEQALLESAELRERIESEVRDKIIRDLGIPELEKQLEIVQEERERLLARVEELSAALAAREVEREKLELELDYVKRDKESLSIQVDNLREKLESIESQLEKARLELEGKQRQLEQLSKEYGEDRAAKEALEAEAERLKARISELEDLLEQYVAARASLEMEKMQLESKLEELDTALRGDSEERPATLEEAVSYESIFIERFNYHMNRFPLVLYDPLNQKEVRVKKWGRASKEDGMLYPESKGPLGRYSKYILYEGLIRKKRHLVIEALSYVRPGKYEESGYDTIPMQLSEAFKLVTNRASEARANNYYHVLLIMSPTGYASKLKEYVSGTEFHKMFLSSNLTLILFDPVTGDVYHHPADPIVEKFASVLKPLTPREELEKAIIKIKELKIEALANSPAMPHFLLREIAEKTGLPLRTIRAAAERLQREGYGSVKVHKGHLVFVYAQ